MTHNTPGKALPGSAFAVRGLASAVLATAAVTVPLPARADDAVLRRVTYTVTADQPSDAEIYYRDIEPPSSADYSHNPYLYSPKAEASVGPGTVWVRDVMLADPDQWAMVAVGQDVSRSQQTLHCALAVDGVVVDTADGSDGALCALRHW